MLQKRYPEYKAFVDFILDSGREFFPDTEIAKNLNCPVGSREFSLGVMQVVRELLYVNDIDMIRWSHKSQNGQEIKGYKLATDEESTKITMKRLHKKAISALRRNSVVAGTINRGLLSQGDKNLYDRQVIRNGLFLSMAKKTSLSKITDETVVRVGKPKLV